MRANLHACRLHLAQLVPGHRLAIGMAPAAKQVRFPFESCDNRFLGLCIQALEAVEQIHGQLTPLRDGCRQRAIDTERGNAQLPGGGAADHVHEPVVGIRLSALDVTGGHKERCRHAKFTKDGKGDAVIVVIAIVKGDDDRTWRQAGSRIQRPDHVAKQDRGVALAQQAHLLAKPHFACADQFKVEVEGIRFGNAQHPVVGENAQVALEQ